MLEFVQMPIDLACFLRAAELISLRDVADVEAAWQVDDLDHTSCGWVVLLKDSRRFYVAYTMDDAEAGRPEDVSIAALVAGEILPEVDADMAVHWYRPDHINRHLRLARPRNKR